MFVCLCLSVCARVCVCIENKENKMLQIFQMGRCVNRNKQLIDRLTEKLKIKKCL